MLRHFNFDLQDEIQFTTYQNIVGLFGQVDFGFNRMFYVTLNGRNDWVSNQSVDNRSLFYKGGSFSFIPANAFPSIKSQAVLNNLKIRGGYGESAGFASGFPTSVNLNIDTQDFVNQDGDFVVPNTVSNTLANPNIKPERYREFEVGLEALMFYNRFSLDVSAYKRITDDLIINRPLSPDTGDTTIQTNIGEIEGKGLEIDASLDIFRTDSDGFSWNVFANFNTYESEVTDLGVDTDIIVYAGFSNQGNAAIVGEQLGVMVGSRIARTEDGEFRVNNQGNYVAEEVDENGRLPIIGDPNPDFILNVGSGMSFKNWNFNFLFNHQQGGDIYSQTVATLIGRGLITETLDRENTYVLPGVNPEGGPNSVQINNSDFYFSNVAFGPAELQVYDATTLRLQELSLGYSFPKKIPRQNAFRVPKSNRHWFQYVVPRLQYSRKC